MLCMVHGIVYSYKSQEIVLCWPLVDGLNTMCSHNSIILLQETLTWEFYLMCQQKSHGRHLLKCIFSGLFNSDRLVSLCILGTLAFWIALKLKKYALSETEVCNICMYVYVCMCVYVYMCICAFVRGMAKGNTWSFQKNLCSFWYRLHFKSKLYSLHAILMYCKKRNNNLFCFIYVFLFNVTILDYIKTFWQGNVANYVNNFTVILLISEVLEWSLVIHNSVSSLKCHYPWLRNSTTEKCPCHTI